MKPVDEKSLSKFLGETAQANSSQEPSPASQPVNFMGQVQQGLNTGQNGLESFTRLLETVERISNSPMMSRLFGNKEPEDEQKAPQQQQPAMSPAEAPHGGDDDGEINQEKTAQPDKSQEKAEMIYEFVEETLTLIDQNMTVAQLREELKTQKASMIKQVEKVIRQ